MAAGFTVRQENAQALVSRLREIADRELSGQDLIPALHADLELDIYALTPLIYKHLEELQPTGMGNPSVTFISRGVTIEKMGRMGEDGKHLNFSIAGCKIGRAVAFNQGDWFDTWFKEKPRFDIAYSIELNRYYENVTQQLNIRDMRPSQEPS